MTKNYDAHDYICEVYMAYTVLWQNQAIYQCQLTYKQKSGHHCELSIHQKFGLSLEEKQGSG